MAFTSQNMAEYGDFNISENEPELHVYLLFDNDILASLDLPFEETKEVEAELQISDMGCPPKRIKLITFKCLRTPDNPIPQNEIRNGE